MKSTLLFLLAALSCAHAQTSDWAYTFALLPAFTNGQASVSVATDGAGGSLWIAQTTGAFAGSGQLLWLNKHGQRLHERPIGEAQVTVIHLTRAYMAVQITLPGPGGTNYLVEEHFSVARNEGKLTETPLAPGQVLVPAQPMLSAKGAGSSVTRLTTTS